MKNNQYNFTGVAMFLQSNEHVGTYYAAVNPELIQPRQALEGDLDCEVLVVGAGFSGLHTALRLVEGGRQGDRKSVV